MIDKVISRSRMIDKAWHRTGCRLHTKKTQAKKKGQNTWLALAGA